MRKSRQYRKDNGLCVYCGARDERTAKGMWLCATCAGKQNRKHAKRREENRDRYRKQSRDLYAKRHGERKCVKCGKQDEWTLRGRSRCAACAAAEKAGDHFREKYHTRKAEHRCTSCGKQDERTLNGMTRCEACSLRDKRSRFNSYIRSVRNIKKGEN